MYLYAALLATVSVSASSICNLSGESIEDGLLIVEDSHLHNLAKLHFPHHTVIQGNPDIILKNNMKQVDGYWVYESQDSILNRFLSVNIISADASFNYCHYSKFIDVLSIDAGALSNMSLPSSFGGDCLARTPKRAFGIFKKGVTPKNLRDSLLKIEEKVDRPIVQFQLFTNVTSNASKALNKIAAFAPEQVKNFKDFQSNFFTHRHGAQVSDRQKLRDLIAVLIAYSNYDKFFGANQNEVNVSFWDYLDFAIKYTAFRKSEDNEYLTSCALVRTIEAPNGSAMNTPMDEESSVAVYNVESLRELPRLHAHPDNLRVNLNFSLHESNVRQVSKFEEEETDVNNLSHVLSMPSELIEEHLEELKKPVINQRAEHLRLPTMIPSSMDIEEAKSEFTDSLPFVNTF